MAEGAVDVFLQCFFLRHLHWETQKAFSPEPLEVAAASALSQNTYFSFRLPSARPAALAFRRICNRAELTQGLSQFTIPSCVTVAVDSTDRIKSLILSK